MTKIICTSLSLQRLFLLQLQGQGEHKHNIVIISDAGDDVFHYDMNSLDKCNLL